MTVQTFARMVERVLLCGVFFDIRQRLFVLHHISIFPQQEEQGYINIFI